MAITDPIRSRMEGGYPGLFKWNDYRLRVVDDQRVSGAHVLA